MCDSIADGGRRCNGRHLTIEQHANRAERRRAADRERKASKTPSNPSEQDVSMSQTTESELTLVPSHIADAVARDGEPRFVKHPKYDWVVVTPNTDTKVGDTEYVRKSDGDIGEFRVRTVMERAVVNGVPLVTVNNQEVFCEWCERFRRPDAHGFPVFDKATTMYRGKPCCVMCREVVRRGREVHEVVAKLGLSGYQTERVVAAAIGEGLSTDVIASAVDAAVAGGDKPRWMSAHLR